MAAAASSCACPRPSTDPPWLAAHWASNNEWAYLPGTADPQVVGRFESGAPWVAEREPLSRFVLEIALRGQPRRLTISACRR